MSPDAVQGVSIGEHTDVEIRGQDFVKSGDFLVSEECVGHPDLQGLIFFRRNYYMLEILRKRFK